MHGLTDTPQHNGRKGRIVDWVDAKQRYTVHLEDQADQERFLTVRPAHVQQVVRARDGEEHGVGVLEQIVVGPYAPAGFASAFDGASAVPEANRGS